MKRDGKTCKINEALFVLFMRSVTSELPCITNFEALTIFHLSTQQFFNFSVVIQLISMTNFSARTRKALRVNCGRKLTLL